MKIREIMTNQVIGIHPEESISVAARRLQRYNIGILPVCESNGELCGLLTDRDIVVRCLAAGRPPENTRVRDVMTSKLIYAKPEMDVSAAAGLMGREQIRRLPVVENGRLCGMVGLGDIARREQSAPDAVDALADITSNISNR